MKQVKLIQLDYKNFKGIKDFTLKANGESLKIYGDNGTGKTSLMDGFTWLLFGKDSNDRTDFEIKTLDEAGNVKQHGLEHSVEGVFEVDGKELVLKRVYKEEWTKKRGSRKTTFSGHTTSYYIDGVPVKKKEYDDKVNQIISEDVFKLLTNPRYFNEKLDWKKRRELLFEIAGDLSDQEIAKGNQDLEEFISNLNGRDVEDHIKVIRSKQKEINKELDRIPVRIDELELNMPDINGISEESVKAKIDEIDSQIYALREQINQMRNGGAISEKKKQLIDIDLEISKIRNDHVQANMAGKYSLEAKIQELESNISLMNAKIKGNNETIVSYQKQLEEISAELQELRKEYKEIKAEEFTYHDEKCTCPTCGQELPEEQVQQAREKALEDFNEKKAERLRKNVTKGIRQKERFEELKSEIEKLSRKNGEMETEIEKQQQQVDKLKKELKAIEENSTDITENPEFVAKMQEKEKIEQEIVKIQTDLQDSISEIEKQITDLEEQRKEQQEILNKLNLVDQYNKRIKTLLEEEKSLAREYEQLEKELFLAETFIQTKADKLEENINRLFKQVKFKLFERQINGGIKPTCITMVNGVPYDRGLNNAGQINAGLEIAEVLSKYYGIYLPTWIDNSESVTKLYEIDTQMIQLVVSEDHKELTVEKKGE